MLIITFEVHFPILNQDFGQALKFVQVASGTLDHWYFFKQNL